MELDPRIFFDRQVLTPFDTSLAETFNGKTGYFSNVTDDFKHLENAVHGVLNLTFGEYPYHYINDEGIASTSGCLYFLPDAWVRKEVDKETILEICHRTKSNLANIGGRQNRLLKDYVFHKTDEFVENRVWRMRDIVRHAYDEFSACLEDLEDGK